MNLFFVLFCLVYVIVFFCWWRLRVEMSAQHRRFAYFCMLPLLCVVIVSSQCLTVHPLGRESWFAYCIPLALITATWTDFCQFHANRIGLENRWVDLINRRGNWIELNFNAMLSHRSWKWLPISSLSNQFRNNQLWFWVMTASVMINPP